MIFVAYREIQFDGKVICLYSDKSQQEAKQFIERTGSHFYRSNTSKLGVHYTKEIYRREATRFEKILERKENVKVIEYSEWEEKRIGHIKGLVTSNVNDLTKAVEVFIKDKHTFCHFQKEYTHAFLNVRADLFGVTKQRKVVSVEVKSDKDTLNRLEKQLKGYKEFSHIVYIATDIKHYPKVEKLLKDVGGLYGVGVLVYENGTLTEEEKPSIRETINATNVLWKNEYQNMLWEFTIKGKSKLAIHELDSIAMNIFTVAEYRKLCEYLFVERYAKEYKLDNVVKFYEDTEHKQKIIDRKYKGKK